jgi:hypothetical protein
VAETVRGAPLAAAVLRLHADRVDLADREERLLTRFTGAHREVAVTRVPVVDGAVADLVGLREIGVRLAADGDAERAPAGRLRPAR